MCRGRKAGALVYIATSSASCFMKRFPEFEMLMIGRVLGGVSTSLLCTVFESWLFTEHKKVRAPPPFPPPPHPVSKRVPKIVVVDAPGTTLLTNTAS